MVGVPALITETFSCSYPKHHRARTHKPEVNKHTSPAAGEPTTVPTANPSLKPAAATTKTTVAKTVKPKPATATTVALPKTGDNNWIAASLALLLLGTVLMAAACRC